MALFTSSKSSLILSTLKILRSGNLYISQRLSNIMFAQFLFCSDSVMYEGIFVFGSKLFETPQSDAISSLPLELSWKIFLYLDGASLRNATRANKLWGRIIMAHRKIRSRLNQFELALKLGSKKLARFYKKNKKIMKKLSRENNYFPVAKSIVESTKTSIIKAKRGGEDFIIHTKRFKRF